MNPLFLKDYYKASHYEQYPPGTNLIFSNFTPRKSRIPGINHSVFFGLKRFLKCYLDEAFNDLFDDVQPDNFIIEYRYLMEKTLGKYKRYEHLCKLLDLEYLPIAIYALPELTVVPCGVPALVMFNTEPEFFWLPNMLETILSCALWGTSTSATIARQYRLLLDEYASKTSDIPEFVDYQAHDFSFRGMYGLEAAYTSGMAHLQYFKGTDTIPSILANAQFYDKAFHLASIPATEHSVMSSYGKDHEFETYKRLLTEVYPSGMVSIVSDTWDLWNVITNYLPKLKDIILSRNGKLVIRPDSGDPGNIICGSAFAKRSLETPHLMGVVECLWEIFGGTVNSKGYKQLDPHIGVIYGDSITYERCKDICERLERKGFASTNVVFGIGSFTYQYNTRDTFGWAFKSTYCEINKLGRNITKDPKTDDGTKKSHSGILKVVRVNGAHGSTYQCLQNQTWDQFYADDNELKLAYKNGKILI